MSIAAVTVPLILRGSCELFTVTRSCRLDDDLGEMLLLLQSLKSRLRIFQAEGNIIQRRANLLLLQEPHHVSEHAARSEIDPTKEAEFPQRAHHVWDLLSAARAPDHAGDGDQTVKSDGTQGLGHCRGAHHIDDVVNATPLWREAPGQLAPFRMLPVVDNVLGAEGDQLLCLCVGARYRDDVGSRCYCDLWSVSLSRSFMS